MDVRPLAAWNGHDGTHLATSDAKRTDYDGVWSRNEISPAPDCSRIVEKYSPLKLES